MTRFGINPSFAGWTSRLPLYNDPLRRGKSFEVFDNNGNPTGEQSPVGADGWPVVDGRWHGVRLFGDQDGFMPDLGSWPASFRLKVNPGRAAWVSWQGGNPGPYPKLKKAFGSWHIPSLEAIAYTKPKILRTLDWGWQARKSRRPDWTKPRTPPSSPLQGEEMALELQCDAANKLNCHLWWNAPPRFELPIADYRLRVEEMLICIKMHAAKPPIIEYGNELWNKGFPVHNWLEGLHPNKPWHESAVDEILILAESAEKVYGPNGPLGQNSHWLYVGGCLADGGFALERILRFVNADIAGCAFYVTPDKLDVERWVTDKMVPSVDTLMESMYSRLPALRLKLDAHRNISKAQGVPYFGVYEAGQSLISGGHPWKQTANLVQKSERMGDLYREIRDIMEGAGVDVCCWYSAATDQAPQDSRLDPFGLLQSTLDLSDPLPKARAAAGQ